MTTRRMSCRTAKPGMAMVIALVFLMLFSSMAVAIVTSADSNLVVARNLQASHRATGLAEIGIELTEVNIGTGLTVPGGNDPAGVHAAIANQLKTAWAGSSMVDTTQIVSDAASCRGIAISLPGGSGYQPGTIGVKIYVSNYDPLTYTTITVESKGACGNAVKTCYYNLTVQAGSNALGLYGVSSKSPVVLTGNARIYGVTDSHGIQHPEYGTILSASYSTNQPVKMTGNVSTSSDVLICNPQGNISETGNVTIGGHVIQNAPEPQWPVVDISTLKNYATTTYSGSGSGNITLSNIIIPPNTNPTFSGNSSVYGIVYVKSPNKVTFSGNTTFCGIIVCDTPTADDLNSNKISFTGNLSVSSVANLPPGAQYDPIRSQLGTFLLAPGYNVSFTGNFHSVSGAMVASQFSFTGNASGIISGGICNLRDSNFTITGNASVGIDREHAVANPAGLTSSSVLKCVAGSYSEL